MTRKIIGVLGGMGPEATLDFFGKIIRGTPAARDQDHLRMIIDNNPQIPDRMEAIIGRGESPVPMMVESGRALARAGADFIVIPCLSAHVFIDELRAQLALPILSAFEVIPEAIKSGYPGVRTVGLLATKGTVRSGRFEKKIRERGLSVMTPELEDLDRVNGAIYRIKSSPAESSRRESRADLIGVAERLIQKGAQGMIAGCTEIPLVLKGEDLAVPFFDSLMMLAEAAIREAGPPAAVPTTPTP
ncbi:MAG: amino acid racemase [Candidatus Aminicenantes bacterium]|nr:amino acid racemase [Candidatus Aminicenantes bacterium]